MTGAINFLHHIGMSVPSLDEARAFYVGLLGFEELGAGAFANDPEIDRIMGLDDAAAQAAFFKLGDCKLELFQFSQPEQKPTEEQRSVHQHGISHFCLDVSDVKTLHKRLSAAGMAFHSAPIDKAGVRTCYGRDPFGNVIELQEIITCDPTQGGEAP